MEAETLIAVGSCKTYVLDWEHPLESETVKK